MSASVAASILCQCKAANKCFTSSHQGACLSAALAGSIKPSKGRKGRKADTADIALSSGWRLKKKRKKEGRKNRCCVPFNIKTSLRFKRHLSRWIKHKNELLWERRNAAIVGVASMWSVCKVDWLGGKRCTEHQLLNKVAVPTRRAVHAAMESWIGPRETSH